MHEIEIRVSDYFKFTMPACFAGNHENIEVSIEYGKPADSSNTVHYNVWARSGNSSVKLFIYKSKVSVGDDAVSNIMTDLNENSDFHEQMKRFIGFIEEKGI